MHSAHARDECCEGPDDRNKLGVNDGLPAVFFVERVRPIQVFFPENLGIFKQAIADFVAYQKAASVAQDRGGGEQGNHARHIELASPGHHSHGEQQRIARQKKPDQQSAFTKDDQEQYQIARPTAEYGGKQVDQLFRIGKAVDEIYEL